MHGLATSDAPMTNAIHSVEAPEDILSAAHALRDRIRQRPMRPAEVIEILERWGAALRGPGIDAIPGVPFLKLWLRGGTLEPIVTRELGPEALQGDWRDEGGPRLAALPLGVVGHWPAGNIEIQPILSLTCALLGGNASLVRVPSGLMRETAALVEKLLEVDPDRLIVDRVFFASFDHVRTDLQRAMAVAVDGAMIWGGRDAVSEVRALPFPHWARVLTFGPRISVAAMDAATWSSEHDRRAWCQRLARDVWQFDQQACSSPQALFLERRAGRDLAEFAAEIAAALREEQRVHPRRSIEPALTSTICLARAQWLLDDASHRAVFPQGPDWTILIGDGPEIPHPIQGRTLFVLLVDSLLDPVSRFNGTVQTLGLAMQNPVEEQLLARAATANGVDRVVKLGRMHVFGSPWDGTDLVRPWVRIVRHVRSQSEAG